MSTDRNDRNTPQKKSIPTTETGHNPSLESIIEHSYHVDRNGRLLNIESSEPNPPYPFLHNDPDPSFDKLTPESLARQFQKALLRAEQSGKPQFIRYRQQIQDSTLYFEARISPLPSGDFKIDVQSLDTSNQMLPEYSDHTTNFETLVSRLPGALYRVKQDPRWTVLYISAGIEEFLGYSPADFMGPNQLALLDVIYEPDRAQVQRLVEENTLQNARFTIEYRMVHADGSLRWVNEQGQAILDENGQTRYLEGIIMDITDPFLQREKTARHNAQLTSIGNLGAGVAHEINNALAIMMANLDYAVEELDHVSDLVTPDQPLRAPLNDIHESLTKLGQGMKRVQKIVHDLRSYSDAAGSQTIETIDLVRLLDWALQESTELTPPITIIRNFPDPTVLLCGNQLGLLQVFSHLFSNALKSFTPPQTPENTITITLKSIQNDAVLIEINDNGCGIPPEILPRIFEPFFSTRPIGEGTGLGLFVCQGIIRSMNGEILISSSPDQGTSVQIILPTNIPSP